MGSSYLLIPGIFAKTGWLGGIILYTVVCLLNVYSMYTILQVATAVSKKRLPNGTYKTIRTYPDLAERL